jgi:hypothetical protein
MIRADYLPAELPDFPIWLRLPSGLVSCLTQQEALALWVSLHAALAAHDLDVFGPVEGK